MPTIYKTIWFFTGGMNWELSYKKKTHRLDGYDLWTQRTFHVGPYLFVISILRKEPRG